MAFMQLHIYSQVLGMDEDVWLFLPEADELENPDEKKKVFLFLHGGSGDQQSGAIDVGMASFARERNMAVIMPNVHRSCFVDMHMGPKYCTYLCLELLPMLRSMFPILSEKREDTIVSGFSNGGYGAFHVAFSYPELFSWTGPFAAGDKGHVDFTGRPPMEKLANFGPGDLTKTKYSVKHQAQELLKSGRPLPSVFHAHGELEKYEIIKTVLPEFFKGLEGNPFNYSHHVIPGVGHDVQCWRIATQMFLDHIGF